MTEPIAAPAFRAVDMLSGTVAEVCGEDCQCDVEVLRELD